MGTNGRAPTDGLDGLRERRLLTNVGLLFGLSCRQGLKMKGQFLL